MNFSELQTNKQNINVFFERGAKACYYTWKNAKIKDRIITSREGCTRWQNTQRKCTVPPSLWTYHKRTWNWETKTPEASFMWKYPNNEINLVFAEFAVRQNLNSWIAMLQNDNKAAFECCSKILREKNYQREIVARDGWDRAGVSEAREQLRRTCTQWRHSRPHRSLRQSDTIQSGNNLSSWLKQNEMCTLKNIWRCWMCVCGFVLILNRSTLQTWRVKSSESTIYARSYILVMDWKRQKFNDILQLQCTCRRFKYMYS